MIHKVMWEHLEEFGSELCQISEHHNGLLAEGTIIRVIQNEPCQVNYSVHMDHSWHTKKLEIGVNHERKLELSSDGNGNWFEDEEEETSLKGAIDIDISATPFSNSLPINRFEWNLNQKRDMEMVYISVPELTFFKVSQTYTYLRREADMRVFLYECRDFKSLIYVDENGFVTNYPDLFKVCCRF
ncbi:putative glycolipid-binding domain-containing protein [Pseudalkalibacillus sp. SCS-8]|uniref:putative glycolipid-binding domain-containing protein n=1 Tax=Pseudalkalibacillus nanhaiensis TaxID=3115291 RepID=UPI0032DA29D0